ncbi:MAG: hypothetical protein IT181_10470 [Acidobacteria bacterium]|nr:hypothetical protein [Acidobacteriota bacterium]
MRHSPLVAAASLSAVAGVAHLGCIAFGGPWYRFFGAGERMARMAEAGHWYPTAITSAIAAVLFTWALYALSGAGVIRRLPLTKLALCLITAVYIGRGVGFVAIMSAFPGNSLTFWLVSSGICLAIGLLHLAGLRQVWARL